MRLTDKLWDNPSIQNRPWSTEPVQIFLKRGQGIYLYSCGLISP
jgi:hypothetical protein